MPDTRPELRLLGTLDLTGPPQAPELLAQSKLVALLSLLTLASAPPPGFRRRDRVVGVFWPELDQGHARAALRKALHAIRQVLGEHAVISRGDEDIGIAPDGLWCDVVEFSAAADHGRLDRALELYRGELLPGFHLSGCADFERWLDDERAAARDRAGGAAWALALRHEQDRDHTMAGQLARRAVRLMAGNERLLRKAMEMLHRTGDRAGAVTLYDEFAKRLRQDLEVEPSDETQQLARRLRGD
jgi:serine/threonine-protein kinase